MSETTRDFRLAFALLLLTTVTPAGASEPVTWINGRIHTLTDAGTVSTLCVADGRIVGYEPCTDGNTIDLAGKTVTPGFIEGHGHLMSLGFSRLNLDLSTARNYTELVQRVAAAVDRAEPGEWILGRGWHQSKWVPQPDLVGGFQTHEMLSAISPDNPVYLVHASGHAAFANAKAMEIAGIDSSTEVSDDGEVIKDARGQPTGVLNELAQGLVRKHIPAARPAQRARALTLALEELARNGITSFQDAGSGADDIALFREFLDEGQLTSRLWVMLSGGDEALLNTWFDKGPLVNAGDDRLTVRAVKLVADGALGSRGAWLLEDYSDMPGHRGLPTMPIDHMRDISHLAYQSGFQVGIHAIGDRANHEVLNIFDALFDGKDRGVRFRIEHAQHLHPDDIPRFASLGVIPAMQGIHMSSDRPWAIDRLGKARIESGAYMWRALVDSGAVLVNGTDVPVEPANPIASFYALVSRQTLAGEPPEGYEPAQKLTRIEALESYTINAAYGAFEEDIKGTLAPGKWADLVVLDQDILTVPLDRLLKTRVLMTVVGGELTWSAN